jgi:hypothetical protein
MRLLAEVYRNGDDGIALCRRPLIVFRTWICGRRTGNGLLTNRLNRRNSDVCDRQRNHFAITINPSTRSWNEISVFR